jgi:N utilization substance protein B
MKDRHKARILTIQALYGWEIAGKGDISPFLDFSWESEPVKSEIKSFAVLLIKGTVDHLPEIDHIIETKLVHWDISRLSKVELSVLRMSIFSLMYIPDIPKAVVINEAVELAKVFGGDKSYKFINGILDNI